MQFFFRSKLFYILIGALLARVVWFMLVGVEPVSDSYIYREFASSLADGNGYAYPNGNLTAYWAVGPSALYALAMQLFGKTALAALIPNLTSGILLIVFTYLVTRHHFDDSTAVIAACLLSAWPVLIQFTTIYASEIHFSALIMWTLYALQQHRASSILQGLHWGSILALACYMRPTAMPFFALLPAAQYLGNKDFKGTLLATTAAILAAFLLVAPWAYRNQTLLGEYVPISANFGSNLWMGNNANSDGGYMPLPNTTFKNELERDNYYKDLAITYIKDNPIQYLKLSIRRIYKSFGKETIGVVWNEPSLTAKIGNTGVQLSKVVSSIYWLAMFLASLVVYCYVIWKGILPFYSPLLIIPAVFFSIPTLTVGQDRYHMALIPFIAMFAAYAIRRLMPIHFHESKKND